MFFDKAFLRATELFGRELNPPLEIDCRRIYGNEVIEAVLVDLKDGIISSALDLPGNCFKAVREASYVLFEMGIDNAITIGNVAIAGELHFTTSQEGVEADVKKGFKPFNPTANAHAWLTLDSGQELDPTILASWWHHKHGREIPLDDAIYLSGLTPTPTVTHQPFITGFAYHLKYISSPFFLPTEHKDYTQWLEHAYIYKSNIKLARSV